MENNHCRTKPVNHFLYSYFMKEILLYNYWEHFKSAKELSMVLPANHPRLIAINKVANELLEKIHSIPESLFIS